MSSGIQSFLKSFVLGRKDFILSRSEYKRIILVGQLCLITFTVVTAYFIYDLLMGITYAWPYQLGCSVLTFISWLLNRNKKYVAAKLLFGFTVNVTLFLFSSIEPVQTGIFIFYIATSLGAFAIFGFEEKGKAFLFVGISILLFILSLTVDLKIMPTVTLREEYILINVIINFVVCTLSSCLIIYFLINLNHHTESALRQNEAKITDQNRELIKINGELDRFVYSTSHDLRAPLSSVQGLIHLTEMSESLPEIKSYIGMMKERVIHLDKFITDISDYSRNSRVEIAQSKIQIKKAVRDSLENLRFYPGSNNVKVELHVPDDLFIISDETRLQMVLSNLISNSFKYRNANGQEPFVNIMAKTISSATIQIAISDNGIGIPAAHLPRIFDMFFQAHENSKGSGLGLYIVKETIQKIKGTISVESQDGKGTQFIIRLPFQYQS
jgi:signal transduction histidine kinase